MIPTQQETDSYSAPETRVAAFMYHDVTDDPFSSGFAHLSARAYTHSRLEFARHLREFSLAPLKPADVTMLDLAGPVSHLLLTFDDGGQSAVYIADELSRRGWCGHFFIVTGRIGTRNFLDEREIRYIRSCGHIVGSHSHTHPNIFRDLSRTRMLEEWRTSIDMLAQLLGDRCDVGSVPGGDISAMTLRVASEAGLRFLFTSEPWLQPRKVDDCWVLGRLCVKSDIRAPAIGEFAAMRGWNRALLERRLKVAASRGLAPLYRIYVRRVTRPDSDLDTRSPTPG